MATFLLNRIGKSKLMYYWFPTTKLPTRFERSEDGVVRRCDGAERILLWFHGEGEDACSSAEWLESVAVQTGAHLVVPEYPAWEWWEGSEPRPIDFGAPGAFQRFDEIMQGRVERLLQQVDTNPREGRPKITVIGHSLGGLICSRWVFCSLDKILRSF